MEGNILFYHPDRCSKSISKKINKYFEDATSCKINVSTSWENFSKKLKNNYNLVGIHSDVFKSDNIEVIDFIKTIRMLLKFNECDSKIAVCVDKECTQQILRQLKESNISGIVPDFNSWDIDSATTGWEHCLYESYWPEEITNQLPELERTGVSVFVPYNTTELEQKSNNELKITNYHTLNKISDAIVAKPDYIAMHIDVLNENVSAIDYIMLIDTYVRQFKLNYTPKLILEFTKKTNLNIIKEFSKAGIKYFVPASNDYGIDETLASMNYILSGVPEYMPKHLISKLPGNVLVKKKENKISLTARQGEIYKLISNRGLSNKQIARMLNISESTVKIHVSAILKTLCVRNRTQLALTKL